MREKGNRYQAPEEFSCNDSLPEFVRMENGLVKKDEIIESMDSITVTILRPKDSRVAEALSLVVSDHEVYRHRLQTLRTCGLKA